MTTIGWAGPHRINHRERYDADWWREAVDRHGGKVLHSNVLECTCGWLSVPWTVEYVDQWQDDGERHARTHDSWRWADGMPTAPSPQTLAGLGAA